MEKRPASDEELWLVNQGGEGTSAKSQLNESLIINGIPNSRGNKTVLYGYGFKTLNDWRQKLQILSS